MDEAAAVLALAIINSSPVLQGELRAQAQQGAQAGADYIGPYFIAALKKIAKLKKENKV
jgi:hypothetical protein